MTCPHCRHQQAVSDAQRRALLRYQLRVAQENTDADGHARELAVRSLWQGEEAKRWGLDGRTGLLTALVSVAIVTLAFVVAGAVGAVRGPLIGAAPAVALAALALVGGVTYLRYLRAARAVRRHARATRGDEQTVACPICGAPSRLGPGDAIEGCRHCRAALIPTAAVMTQGVGAARTARGRVALERYRAERAPLRVAPPFVMVPPDSVAPFAVGSMLVITSLAGMAITVRLAGGEGGLSVGVAATLWLVVAAIAALLVVLMARRRNRRRRLRAALERLARQHRGQRLAGVRDALDWLDRHWSGPWSGGHARVGVYEAVALQLGPFPALFEYAPHASRRAAACVQLLVAAAVPGASEGGPSCVAPAVTPHTRALGDAGWWVQFHEGGVVLQVAPSAVPQWLDPDALGLVAPMIERAVHLLDSAGCRAAPLDHPR